MPKAVVAFSKAGLADTVLLNGKIWTVDPGNPEVEALAIRDGRILAAGTTEDISSLAERHTRAIDLEGKRVLPGFNDSHVHFSAGGFTCLASGLRDAKNVDEFGRQLASTASSFPEGTWITSGVWDNENWPGSQLPTAELIDRYVSNHPVMVRRFDGHMAAVNSIALEAAGITSKTVDPSGGVIVRKEGSMEPSGLLKDSAQELVLKVIPEKPLVEKRAAIIAALAESISIGRFINGRTLIVWDFLIILVMNG